MGKLRANSEIISDKSKNPVTTSTYIKHGNQWLDDAVNNAIGAAASKADKTYVDNELAKKADSSALTSKADASTVSALSETVSAISDRVSATETEQDTLSARMDEFTKLKEGSTTGDAELIDGRVGADGKTYDNIGGAIRGQVTDLKSDLDYLTKFDNYEIINGYFVKYFDGILVEYNGLKVSSRIDVHKAKYVKIVINADNVTDNKGCVFYNKYGEYISGVQYNKLNTYLIEVPENAYYFTFTITSENDTVNIYNSNNYDNDEVINIEYEKIQGKYIRWTDGKLIEYELLSCTNSIKVNGFGTIKLSLETDNALDARGCAFYDENNIFISGIQYNKSFNYIIPIPDNAYYFAFTVTGTQNTITVYPKPNKDKITELYAYNPCKYAGDSISVFNRGICIGDSLTKGVFNQNVDTSADLYMEIDKYSYPTILSKMTGIELVNMGNSGNTTKSWYILHQNDDLSGYDFAIINLGANDKPEKNITVAESGEYLGRIVTKLKNQNQKIKIFITTLLPNYYSTNEELYSQINETRISFVEENFNCYLIDLTRFSSCKANTPYSQGHLTAIGYAKEASELKSYISYIIDSNLDDFKDVQFANTHYGYN